MRVLLAWLASFRLRVLFRTAFLLLALAVLAMAAMAADRPACRRFLAAGGRLNPQDQRYWRR